METNTPKRVVWVEKIRMARSVPSVHVTVKKGTGNPSGDSHRILGDKTFAFFTLPNEKTVKQIDCQSFDVFSILTASASFFGMILALYR